MKELHLICNAHIDPIWQWEWEEGVAAAISTFRSAADLSDEFDYIFCHNEVSLYKNIEEYAPDLFERIKVLIRKGKWHIMGGWYLQPDCNMPQGESFIRQIQVGHMYFKEKFDASPTTAICFDAFGHTRGLVQICKKCGQDSYILCRTGDDPVPSAQFMWEGFDGSKIAVLAAPGYANSLGNAAETIKRKAEELEQDTICVLWGVGNHGGGPSRKDLKDIEALMAEGTMKIIHSTPESFFAKINPQVVHDKSLRTSMAGCYTTMSKIKQGHASLENQLWTVEKMCSVAALKGLIEYPEKELDEVVEDLLNCEFHDVLPGSSIKAGEENGLRLIEHGLQILNTLRARAFFALSSGEESAKEGEYPILVFNPLSYEYETDVTCEMMLSDQNWNQESVSHLRIEDKDGNRLPIQKIKEESNLTLDWRKKIIFHTKLKPLEISRFSVYVDFLPPDAKTDFNIENGITFDAPGKHVEIDKKTGLLRSYKLNGREIIRDGAFKPYLYKDNEDPWGMGTIQCSEMMGENPVEFKLMEHPDGVFSGMKPIQVIENGDIYLGVECFFECENTRLRIEYDIYKNTPAIDIKIDSFINDCNRMLKVEIPCADKGRYIGQTAFGTEELYENGRECVAQRFVAVKADDGNCVALLNRGTYGSSYKDGSIFMSLLRSATYCAHPLGDDRPLVPTDRFTKKIDIGERNFAFRLTIGKVDELNRLADEFNLQCYALNVFPVTASKKPLPFNLSVSDNDISFVAMKKQQCATNYILRFYNGCDKRKKATVRLNAASINLDFSRYEVKTLVYDGEALTETFEMKI